MIFDEENLQIQLLGVFDYYDEKAVSVKVGARPFCALSLRLDSDAQVVLKKETIALKTRDLAFFPANTPYERQATHDRMIGFHFNIANLAARDFAVLHHVPYETLLPLCVEYGRIMVLAGPIWSLQILFQGFLVTADRPHMGLWLSVAAGCVNIGLDLLLVGVFDFGLAGAGYASMAGMFVGGLVPLRVFFDKKSLLHFEKPVWKGKELLLAMGNGASEMVTSLSSAITTALFNLQMMAIVGEKGVAAISAILYLQFVFVALLIGFTSGVAPIFSYNYGAGNRANIHKLFAISARMVLSFSLAMLVVAELLDRPMVLIFASKDPVLRDLMIVGFRIIAISVFFTGINIFASGFFTAMNNGRVSALVSILRTLVLEVGALLLMPMWWGINGVWWALPVAEILASLVAVSMLLRYRKTYGY